MSNLSVGPGGISTERISVSILQQHRFPAYLSAAASDSCWLPAGVHEERSASTSLSQLSTIAREIFELSKIRESLQDPARPRLGEILMLTCGSCAVLTRSG